MGIPFAGAVASAAVDVGITQLEMYFQQKQLGIDNEYLTKQASHIPMEFNELVAQIKLSVQGKAKQSVEKLPFKLPLHLISNFETVCGKMMGLTLELMLEKDAITMRAAFAAAIVAITAPLMALEEGASLVPILGAIIGVASSST